MGQTWTDDVPPPPPNGEHPVVALIAVIAIIAAIVLIAWARLELRGTAELEAALSEPSAQAPTAPPEGALTEEEREVDEAVTSSRFATGFSP